LLCEGAAFSAAARAWLSEAAAGGAAGERPAAPPLARGQTRLVRTAADGALFADAARVAAFERAAAALLCAPASSDGSSADDNDGDDRDDASAAAAARSASCRVRRLPRAHFAGPRWGLFAGAAGVAARTPLLSYGGEVVTGAEAAQRVAAHGNNGCVMALRGGALACDAGTQPRCRAAYANDPRGSGLPPNCAYVEVRCGGGCLRRAAAAAGCRACRPGLEHSHALLVSLCDVAPGEELLVRYGDAYWAGGGDAAAAEQERRGDGAAARALSGKHVDLLRAIFALLPVHDRAACAAVQRSWRRILREPASWRAVRLGDAPAPAAAPLRALWALEAAAAHADGTLHELDLRPLGLHRIASNPLRDERDERAQQERHLTERPFFPLDGQPAFEGGEAAPNVWGVLARCARANPGLRRVALTRGRTAGAAWRAVRPRTAIAGMDGFHSWSSDGDDGRGAFSHAPVGRVWDPATLAALAAAPWLPAAGITLLADVQLRRASCVRRALALMQQQGGPGRVRLELEGLRLNCGTTDALPPALAGAFAHALRGPAGAPLRAVALSGSWASDFAQRLGRRADSEEEEEAEAPLPPPPEGDDDDDDDDDDKADDEHAPPGARLALAVLDALAAAATQLVVLELRDAAPRVLRAAAAALRAPRGALAFALRRLDVLLLTQGRRDGGAATAAAATALAAALPRSLQVLCVDVRAPLADAEPLLAAFAAAAAARCPALRVLDLAFELLRAADAAAEEARARAAEARLLSGVRRAAPGAHATLRGYRNVQRNAHAPPGVKLPHVPRDMPGCPATAAAVWAPGGRFFGGPQGWGLNGEGW
jgi:hypothetical protein